MPSDGERAPGPPLQRTPLSTAFGSHIRQIRLELGYSQEELAARAQLDRTFVGRVERGEFRISLENAAALARACDVSLWKILQRAEETGELLTKDSSQSH